MGKKRRRLIVISLVSVFALSGTLIMGSLPLTAFSEVKAGIEAEAASTKLVESHLSKANQYMGEKTVENLEKAIKEIETALEIDPNNYEALWMIAKAYTDIIAIKTSALIIEKDEYKPLLKELGKKADIYARRALEINPEAKESIAAAALAHGYYSASFGIAKAILKGAAGRYKKLCNQLIEIDEEYGGALGYKMMGKLYYVAPWPVGSEKKSIKFYKKALEVDNSLLEPHYYLGMIYLENKEYDLAKQEFEFVVENPPLKLEEFYIGEFKNESSKHLEEIQAIEMEK